MSEMKHTPNPLPCGCGVMGRAGFNAEGTLVEYKGLYIKFCPKHAAAPEIYKALEAVIDWDTDHPVSYVEFEEIRKQCDAVLLEARGT